MAKEVEIPSLLDNELENKLAEALTAGASLRVCANYAGVSFGSIVVWMDKGQQLREEEEKGKILTLDEQRYVRFYTTVEERRNRTIVAELANIRRIARDENKWEASKWLLSKLAPHDYGDKIEITTEQHHTVQIEAPTDINRFRDLRRAMEEAELPLPSVPEIVDGEIVEEREEA